VDVGPRQRIVVEEGHRFAAERAVRSDLAQHHQHRPAGAVDHDRPATDGRGRSPSPAGGLHRAAAQEQEQQDPIDDEQGARVAVELEDGNEGEHREHAAEHHRLRQPHDGLETACRHSP
jgi:hypothetical protein